MSDKERDQQDAGDEAAADAKEDLELTDEDADQVAGGLSPEVGSRTPPTSTSISRSKACRHAARRSRSFASAWSGSATTRAASTGWCATTAASVRRGLAALRLRAGSAMSLSPCSSACFSRRESLPLAIVGDALGRRPARARSGRASSRFATASCAHGSALEPFQGLVLASDGSARRPRADHVLGSGPPREHSPR